MSEVGSRGAIDRVRDNWLIMWRHGQASKARPSVGGMRVAGFTALTLVLAIAAGIFLDARILELVQGQSPASKAFFRWITDFGKSDWLLIPAGLTVVVVTLGNWQRVGRREAAAWSEIAAFAMVLFLAIAASGLFTDALKVLFGRTRPPFITDTVFEFGPLTFAGYAGFSFPSGHSSTAGALAAVLAYGPRGFRLFGVLAALLVAASRVMIGVHFVSDVVAGFLIGCGISWLIIRAMAWGGFGFRRPRGRYIWRFGVLGRFIRSPKYLLALIPALWGALRP
jgi:membrane-associated phospholipid phosphatase